MGWKDGYSDETKVPQKVTFYIQDFNMFSSGSIVNWRKITKITDYVHVGLTQTAAEAGALAIHLPPLVTAEAVKSGPGGNWQINVSEFEQVGDDEWARSTTTAP